MEINGVIYTRTDFLKNRPKICPDDSELLEYESMPDFIKFHEPYQDIFFFSSAAQIQTAKLLLNRLFMTTGRAPISYFYQCLDLPFNKSLEQIGWCQEDAIKNDYHFIDITEEYTSDKTPTDEEWFEIRYLISPTFIGF